ncbi:MaoC family dehydratase [Sphingomicrobium marinum]|uniref:MaoC family dehydratase n=1 Tax=Sphingomicrobium marinum TaxID=1227950 RepID=UPI00223ED5D0|nr:MaoC family dehydratase [Sphingomicrobium marinum]
MMFFEDVTVGDTVDYGSVEVSRQEVLDFARRYDPQPFHLSDDAAAMTPFGKIAASGWHTASMVMRLMVDRLISEGFAALGSPGVEALKWHKPVFPGDTISARSEVIEKIESRSKPFMGIVKSEVTVTNQDGVVVMTSRPTMMVARKPAS